MISHPLKNYLYVTMKFYERNTSFNVIALHWLSLRGLNGIWYSGPEND